MIFLNSGEESERGSFVFLLFDWTIDGQLIVDAL